jgi:hypothetical protein
VKRLVFVFHVKHLRHARDPSFHVKQMLIPRETGSMFHVKRFLTS